MAHYARLRPDADFTFASFSDLGSDVVCVDPGRIDVAIRVFADMHRTRPFTAVLNRKEKCVVPAAVLARALGLPPITTEPELARDKFAMRRALNCGAEFPRTVLIRGPRDVDRVETDMFPCVVKPRYGFNSRSALLVQDRQALEAAYRDQHAHYARLHKQDGTNSDFVCEELIPGSEHTIETLVRDGTALFHLISDKLPMEPPYFVEIGDQMPSRLSAADQAICRAATERAIPALGIRNGWTHTEVKLEHDQAVVVECAARMGGGYFEDLFRDVYGIDRMGMLIDLHVGGDPIPAPAARLHAAARRIVVYGPARLRTLEDAEALFAADRVTLVWPATAAMIDRELAGPPFDFNNTLCEFIARGSTGEEAAALADRLVENAVVRTSEP